MLYAEVMVKQRTQVQELTYGLNAQILPYVKVGSPVIVPLRRKSVVGVIVGFSRSVPREVKAGVREIIKLADNGSVYSASQIEVIHRLALHYSAPLAEVAFHALDLPQFLPYSTKERFTKPVVLTGSWSARLDAYRRIIAKSSGRVLLIFAQNSYLDSFSRFVRGSNPSYRLYPIREFGGKRGMNELMKFVKKDNRAVLIGMLGDVFFPLRSGDFIIIDQPYHVGAKSQLRPFMTARRIAMVRAQVENLQLVLGDTLISPEDLLLVKDKQLRMASAKHTRHELTIIDRRGQKEPIVPSLLEEIESSIRARRKILVLVLARGWASALVCRDCGHVFGCSNCKRTASVHSQELRCGYCSTNVELPKACPACQSEKLKPIGEGVSAVKRYLADHFPSAKVAELSGDQPILDPVTRIVVATEKIFSFPDAVFDQVFVINADRLLSGVHLDGVWRLLGYLIELQSRSKNISIQTLFPNSIVWAAASSGNVRPFFSQELANRQQLNLPPYGAVIVVRGSAGTTEKLFAQTEKITDEILKVLPKADISYPEVDDRSGGNYHGHITIYLPKPPQNSLKNKLATVLPPSWHLDLD